MNPLIAAASVIAAGLADPLVRSFKIKEHKPFSFYYYFLREKIWPRHF